MHIIAAVRLHPAASFGEPLLSDPWSCGLRGRLIRHKQGAVAHAASCVSHEKMPPATL